MPNDELVSKSAAEMAALVRERKISPVELVEAHLARIEELQPKLNAFVTVDSDGARCEARAAESAVMNGEQLGTLHGVLGRHAHHKGSRRNGRFGESAVHTPHTRSLHRLFPLRTLS